MPRDYISKIIILGEPLVGKTSIINSILDQKFTLNYKPTIGADFCEKYLTIDQKTVHLEIWDTAGQEKFRSLGTAFYRGSHCAVLVYDISNHRSFETLESWMAEINEQNQRPNGPEVEFFLVGNKVDLVEDRKVKEEEVDDLLKKYRKMRHFETSVLYDCGVKELFEEIGRVSIEILEEIRKNEEGMVGTVDLNRRGCKCCSNRRHKKRSCC